MCGEEWGGRRRRKGGGRSSTPENSKVFHEWNEIFFSFFPGSYGIRVKSCFAFNKRNNSVPLIDEKGWDLINFFKNKKTSSASLWKDKKKKKI